ncbi:hypothetical protein GSI_07612 [Ganoderma sinense ZZ0214-1]|uniref:Uncharacterized protein n=1 Tax=Ganoderma sinense ZZ0214-1 TaxID=1077348 RepID=A0A2G8S9J1_9APHY|nr:hypothetical protein GSI_07612 [Ganoderma sinense ZZ0214-1]
MSQTSAPPPPPFSCRLRGASPYARRVPRRTRARFHRGNMATRMRMSGGWHRGGRRCVRLSTVTSRLRARHGMPSAGVRRGIGFRGRAGGTESGLLSCRPAVQDPRLRDTHDVSRARSEPLVSSSTALCFTVRSSHLNTFRIFDWGTRGIAGPRTEADAGKRHILLTHLCLEVSTEEPDALQV